MKRAGLSVIVLWVSMLLSGCMVRTYHPMSGLHRPTVVDPQAPNFQDVDLTIRCLPGDALTRQGAQRLCQRVGTLFENQGARVTTTTLAGEDPGEALDREDQVEESTPRSDLTMVLSAREIDRNNHPLSYAMCVVTFTLVPWVRESTFAQDVEIRDGTGFLLLRDSLQGRTVEYFGLGTWAGHQLLDLTKEKDERLSGEAANQDLSDDLYKQLSQLAFNAKMHWKVLQEAGDGRMGAR